MLLQDFMHYPDIGCRLAMMRRYEWSNSGTSHVQQSLLQKLWFLVGAVNLVYQNLGMIIYLFLSEPPVQELGGYVAQISETCSVMGLTLVGACNMWMLMKHRKGIEFMLFELQQLYPRRGRQQKFYRIRHYYEQAAHLMKYTTIFFMSAYAYYNSLPIIELIYELSADSQYFRYKYQSNTWYPWQLVSAKDSVIAFIVAYLSQALSSLVGVAFIMASQFLLCFFTMQMQLHFDALATGLRLLDASQPDANDQLKVLLAYHSRLLNMTEGINRVFNFTFLINFTTSTIAICLMAFAMVMSSLASTFKYSVGLLSFLVFTLFICYNGTQFTSASEKLLPAAFYNNWYDGNIIYRRMLVFFMMRSRESQILRTYKFTPVSMATYMAILKFSYQLFTFVRTMI